MKAFKVLYGFAEDHTMTLAEAEAQLDASLEATRSLYLFMLDIIPALTAEARMRLETARAKFNPTEEELNPNMKFVENGVASLLEEDPDFQKAVSRTKLSWEPFDAFVRNLYDSVRGKEYFVDYMESGSRSLAEDAGLWVRIFEEEFVDSAELASILEDLSIWWNDDLAYSLSYCCDTMRSFAKGHRWELIPLFRSDMFPGKALESDKAFVFKLLRVSYANYDKYVKLIDEMVPQWDMDRLFVTDIVLITMGLGEAKAFPSIPLRVTINEYVEISKFFGTPKSRSFVNGLLDRLSKKLIAEGEIVKDEITQ